MACILNNHDVHVSWSYALLVLHLMRVYWMFNTLIIIRVKRVNWLFFTYVICFIRFCRFALNREREREIVRASASICVCSSSHVFVEKIFLPSVVKRWKWYLYHSILSVFKGISHENVSTAQCTESMVFFSSKLNISFTQVTCWSSIEPC